MKESLRQSFETPKQKKGTTENAKMAQIRNMISGVGDSIRGCFERVQKWNGRRQIVKELGKNSKNLGKIAAGVTLGGIAAMTGSDISTRPAYAQEARDTEWREPECFSFDGFSEKGLAPHNIEKIDNEKISLIFSGYPAGQETTLGRDLYEVIGDGLDEIYGPYGIPSPIDQYNTAESEVDFTRLPDGREGVVHKLKSYPYSSTLIFDGEIVNIGDNMPIVDVSHDLQGEFLLGTIPGLKSGDVARIPADNPTTYEYLAIKNDNAEYGATETLNPASGKKELWISADWTGTQKLYRFPETETGWGDYEAFPYNSDYYEMAEPNFTQDGTIMFFAGRFERGGELFICVTDREGSVTPTPTPTLTPTTTPTATPTEPQVTPTQNPSPTPTMTEFPTPIPTPTGTIQIDYDGDGWPVSSDCNDNDASIYPGAVEYCDEIDQNCDGDATSGAVDQQIYYLDADGDGYGDPESFTLSCTQLANYVVDNTDCDDTNPDINHGQVEIFDNGVDDDCNATTPDTLADLGTPDISGGGTQIWVENENIPQVDDQSGNITFNAPEIDATISANDVNTLVTTPQGTIPLGIGGFAKTVNGEIVAHIKSILNEETGNWEIRIGNKNVETLRGHSDPAPDTCSNN